MTEERIKELARQTHNDWWMKSNGHSTEESLIELIRTVAAEAWKEGWEAGIERMGKRAYLASYQMNISDLELDAYKLRLDIATKELREKGK